MLRKVLAAVAGIIAGVVTVGVVESVGHLLYPPPASVDVTNPESLRSVMDILPLGAKLAVIVAWALGSLVAGLVAAKVAATKTLTPSLVAGLVILAGGLYTLVTIPHPAWMAALGVLLPLPMAWFGSRILN